MSAFVLTGDTVAQSVVLLVGMSVGTVVELNGGRLDQVVGAVLAAQTGATEDSASVNVELFLVLLASAGALLLCLYSVTSLSEPWSSDASTRAARDGGDSRHAIVDGARSSRGVDRSYWQTPGDEIDRDIYEHRSPREYLREQVRERLVRDQHYAPDEADARIATGEWTDDPLAAAYLADEPIAPSLRARVVWYLSGRSAEDWGLDRALAAIERLEEEPRE